MFSLAGPSIDQLPGRLELLARHRSVGLPDDSAGALLCALETWPPREHARAVVGCVADGRAPDELVRAFLEEIRVPVEVEKVRFDGLERFLTRRIAGDDEPLSLVVLALDHRPLVTLDALENYATRIVEGGLLFVSGVTDDERGRVAATRVLDAFLAKHSDFEVVLRRHFLIARRRLPPDPFALEQVNLCLTFKACNLSCPACWTVYSKEKPSATGKPAAVPWEKLQRFLASPSLEDKTIVVIGGGEPFMYQSIESFLREAPTIKRRVMIMTNGTLLHTKPAFWEIARTAPITISMSLDAARPETYSFVRRPAKWDVTMANIDRLLELRDTVNPLLEFQTSFVVLRQNVGEMLEFMELNKKWKSTYVHFHPALPAGFPEEWRLKHDDPLLVENSQRAIAFAQQHGIALDPPGHLHTPLAPDLGSAPVPADEQEFDPRVGCLDYRRQVAVDVAGDTFVCDTAFRIGYSLGNAFENDISTLWNGPRWQSLRETHAKGTQKQHPLCKHCMLGGC